MRQKFILRFDDLSPYHDKLKWEQIESFLIENNVRPIIAIIPDNKDENTMFNSYDNDFWCRVKRLQSLGWSIALHGYQHLLKECHGSIVKINTYGEICDSSYEEQKLKIKTGLSILESHGVNAKLYCAPAHSFDRNTLKALLDSGIKTITDGFFLKQGYSKKYNLTFIPQQLWRFRRLPIGVYTICYHHNSMSDADIYKFKQDIINNIDNIISADSLSDRRLNIFDYIFSFVWTRMLIIKNKLAKYK